VCSKNDKKRLRPTAKSLMGSLRDFLTPALWKQAKQTRPAGRRPSRWRTQPLVMVLLVMTWCCGDSQAERFETAKAFCVACWSKRRRPGKTWEGFQKALAKTPLRLLRAVATGVRQRITQLLELHSEGWMAFGCDGSRLECPRTTELEKRLDRVGKARSGPTLWVTALVHLRTGLLWSWWFGKGANHEREHLLHLLPTLPPRALLVMDAGFNGYLHMRTLQAGGFAFLIRASGKDILYALDRPNRSRWRDGIAYCWPEEAKAKRLPPLKLRVLHIRSKKRKDVWLLTNVYDVERLPFAMASRYYRWRWENEGLFRTYKRTLDKVKLMSRSVRLAHREAEGALLATQLLLAQGAYALETSPKKMAPQGPNAAANVRTPIRCSARKVLLAIREEIQGQRRRHRFHQLLGQAVREQRRRRTPKATRKWPRRQPAKRLKPPIILKMSGDNKALMHKLESRAA